jgi:UDP-N-acetyl-D-galactosamine dehydrogenase
LIIDKSIGINKSDVLIMGLTFKENCPDIRNSKVFDLIKDLEKLNINISIYDPHVDQNLKEVEHMKFVSSIESDIYDGLIIAVAHNEFIELGGEKIKSFMRKNSVILDITSCFNKDFSDKRI